MHVRVTLLLLIPLLGITASLRAQDTAGLGTLRGRVIDASGAVVKDVAVCVAGTGQCGVTAADGAVSIAVRPGTYALEVIAPGQALVLTDPVRIQAGLDSLVDIALPKSDGVQQSVTVTAPRLAEPQEVKTSAFLIAPEEVAASASALQDVARYVQALPGVAIASDDFRNDLIVRGGSPLENLYVVDNIEIPNINTFATFASAGGTVSILDVQLIENVTFMSGGYPSPFGNRTSSVLQIAQREGAREATRGRATLGFAGAGAVVEGPLGAAKKGSWILSARRSFLDVFTNDTGIGGVPVLYTLNGKAVYDLSPRDRVWAVNLTGVDRVRLGLTEDTDLSEGLANFDIRYQGWRSAAGVNWQRVFGRGVGLFGVSYAHADVNQRVSDILRSGVPLPGSSVEDQIAGAALVFREQSSEADTAVKYEFTTTSRLFKKIQAGVSVKRTRIDYDTASPFGTDSPFFTVADANPFVLREQFTAWQLGGYAQATRAVTPRLNMTAGARLDRYGFISSTKVSPRLGADYEVSSRLSLRASYGQYYQQPFFLFLAAYPENRSLAPFRADHYVGGLSFSFDRLTRATFEAYRKPYRDYPVSSQIPSLSLANVGDTFAIRDILFPMTSAGRGTVDGVEAYVERRADPDAKWHGEANLAFSRARYSGTDGVARPGSFDYPVVANVSGTWRFSRAWTTSARMTYLAGRPFTPVDEALSGAQRRLIYDLSQVNGRRGPDYFRIDLRIDRTFRRGDRTASIFAGVQNVTNRKNFAAFSWDRRNNRLKTSEQLGVFPILGVDWPF